MDFKTRSEYYVTLVNSALEGYLADKDLTQQVVVDAMQYSLLSGGKRIRAILVLEFCRICGGDISLAVPFACAVEMLHCYSLIHDDLPCMDNDDMRRGQPSCHIKFGEANALLAGDGLLTLAFDTIFNQTNQQKLPPADIIKAGGILAQAAGFRGMVGGQIIDIQNETDELSIEDLSLVNDLKTGAIIRAAAIMGCVVARAEDPLITLADAYSKKIGLSFQIVDDILDIVGLCEEIGKPVGSDNHNHKATFATLLGTDKSFELVLKLADEAKECLGSFPNADDFIYEFTDSLTIRKR